MSVCGIQSLMCLSWKFTFHLISDAMCCLPTMVMWGTNSLIGKRTLQFVVWKYYSTCPNLLIDLSCLILKICCMCVCGGFTSGRFGHIGYWLMLVCQHWSGITPQFLLMELILGMPTYIGCWVSHCMLTMYFPYNLGPSIVKLSTDHSLFNYYICFSCIYMSVLLVYLQICYSACTLIVYIYM